VSLWDELTAVVFQTAPVCTAPLAPKAAEVFQKVWVFEVPLEVQVETEFQSAWGVTTSNL